MYNWQDVKQGYGTTAERNAADPGLGRGDGGRYIWYNTTVGRLQIWNGEAWENMSGVDE